MKYDNKTVCDIPISALADEAPKYEREWVEIKKPEYSDLEKKLDNINLEQTIKNLLSHPNQADKSWVWEQYDHMVMCDTVEFPVGDAAVIRIHGNNKKAIAASLTVHQDIATPILILGECKQYVKHLEICVQLVQNLLQLLTV